LEQVGLELQDQVECRAQQDRLALLEPLEQELRGQLDQLELKGLQDQQALREDKVLLDQQVFKVIKVQLVLQEPQALQEMMGQLVLLELQDLELQVQQEFKVQLVLLDNLLRSTTIKLMQ
jgi:hypothetical protein